MENAKSQNRQSLFFASSLQSQFEKRYGKIFIQLKLIFRAPTLNTTDLSSKLFTEQLKIHYVGNKDLFTQEDQLIFYFSSTILSSI